MYKNTEGYPDPTAGAACANIEREQRQQEAKRLDILKCKRCIHYYRTMVTEHGYNPAPYCHCWEDTGKSPSILTQECFESRKRKKDRDGVKSAKKQD